MRDELKLEPLVVGPREAKALGGWGHTRLYELIRRGELLSYKDGKARRIVVASIHDYIDKKLASVS